MKPSVIAGNVFGVVGLIAGVYYFLRSGRIPTKIRGIDDLREAFEKLLRRRRVTAVVMIVIAVLFLIGINLIDRLGPWETVAVWSAVLGLLIVLLVLAFIDLRALGAIRDQLQQRVKQHIKEAFDLYQRAVDDEDN